MNTSKRGLEFTASSEGVKLTAYKDTGGVWTIGVGHTSDSNLTVTPGLTITKEKAIELLAIDMQEAEEAIAKLVTVSLTQGQYDALADFAFNAGETQFRTSTLLKKVNAQDWQGAAAQFDRWVYDEGKVQPGLVKRAHGRKQMFLEA